MKEARGLTNVFPRTFFLFQTDLIMNYCLLAKLKPDLCTYWNFFVLHSERDSGRKKFRKNLFRNRQSEREGYLQKHTQRILKQASKGR